MKIPLHAAKKTIRALELIIGPLKEPQGILANYRYFAALHVLRASQGYARAAVDGDIYSCRLLLRPIIETFLKMSAVRNTPETLYDIALDDYKYDRYGLDRGDRKATDANKKTIEDRVAEFNTAYANEFADQTISYATGGRKLNLRELEAAAKIPGLYDVHYRHACSHSHGSLRAMSGGLDLPNEFAMMNVMVAAACLEAMHSLVDDFGLDPKVVHRAKYEVEKLL